MHYSEYPTASSEAITKELGQRLDRIRLSRNVSQKDRARFAGKERRRARKKQVVQSEWRWGDKRTK